MNSVLGKVWTQCQELTELCSRLIIQGLALETNLILCYLKHGHNAPLTF